MKEYFIHKSSGEITATGLCQDEYFDTQTRGDPDLSVVEGKAEYGRDYWDGSAVAAIPVRPSDNHIFDYITKTWIDPRTLADLKTAKWGAIKAAREAALTAPLVTSYGTFDANAEARANIADAVLLANNLTALGQTVAIDFTLYDNSVKVLDAPSMVQVGLALGGRTQTVRGKATDLRTRIDATTSAADLDLIVW